MYKSYPPTADFRKYLCPCCGYPTLSVRGSFEICGVCDWEDDGQNDGNANETLGGPNGDYSLTEARSNFQNFATMYRPSDPRFSRFNKEKLKEIIDLYEQSFQSKNSSQIKLLFDRAESLATQLRTGHGN
jgi:hypothetical protein